MAFMYKWHNLCINSGLEVGDTYFFSVIHEGIDYGDDDDEEWEHDQEMMMRSSRWRCAR